MPSQRSPFSSVPLLRPFQHRAGNPPAAARLVLKLMQSLQVGSLDVRLPDGTIAHFGEGEPHAQVALNNWNVCAAALKSGDIGFAETFIDGDWHTDDLTALLDVLIRNRTMIEKVVYGSWFGRLLHRLRHLRNANSRTGSRRNIHAHYDLGNAFYGLWLDPSMTYSSALFDPHDASRSLQQAQEAKYRRVVEQLELKPGARVLEIGCGWGGFAELAAREKGARVTGLTLSSEQLAYAKQRMSGAGLDAQADLRLQDYRDVSGQYDGIASIEMFEAVGEQYWPSFFECVKRSMKAGGRACVQSIVIDNALFERYRKSTDFIQQYVFPGGMLPSPAAFTASAARHGLKVTRQHAFGADYARTLREWCAAFHARLPEVRAQGFDDRFVRIWEFYLCYCEAAFANANTDVIQFTLEHA